MDESMLDFARTFLIGENPERDAKIREAWASSREAEKQQAEAEHARYMADLDAKAEELADRAGLSKRAMACIGAGLKDWVPMTEVKKWSGEGTLVLSGGKGAGKTVAANKWLWDLIFDPLNWENHVGRARFALHEPLLVTAAHMGRWKRYDDNEMDRLLKASRLVIDDIGTEFMDTKGSYMVLLDEVIDVRYAQMLPTVITTNVGMVEFFERVGERVARRIREDGFFVSCGTVQKQK